MPLSKIQAESMNLADNYAFTGTVSGAGGGKVIQQQFATFNNSGTSITSSSLTSTNITDSITPTASNSKIMIMVEIPVWGQVNTSGSNDWWLRCDFALYRNSSSLVSSRIQSGSGKSAGFSTYGHTMSLNTFIWQDSPSTTSSTSYTFYLAYQRLQGTGGSANYDGRGVIILTEIGA
jgi:hypothetical protein